MAAVQRAVAAVVEAAEEQEVALVLTRWRLARLLRRPPSGFATRVRYVHGRRGVAGATLRARTGVGASSLRPTFAALKAPMEISPRTHAFTHTFPSTGPPFS